VTNGTAKKIALIGFDEFPEWQEALRKMAAEADVELVTDQKQADITFVPNHRTDLFPPQGWWVVVAVRGDLMDVESARGLPNPPVEGWQMNPSELTREGVRRLLHLLFLQNIGADRWFAEEEINAPGTED